LSTIKSITPRKSALYCPTCKKLLKQSASRYICPSCGRTFPIINGIPSLIVSPPSASSFDASEFEFLFQMEQKHFWHVGRKELILDIMRRNIRNLTKSRMLEVGCGNGSVLAYLINNGIMMEGGDVFMEGLAFCRQRANSVPLYQIDVTALPFRNEFDIVGLFDVLEHIDDDAGALCEVSQALKRRGMILITVPAHQFLWSYFDVRSNHKRRYQKKDLIAKLEKAGFTIKKASYYMFFLFPAMAAIRLIGNIKHHQEDRQIGVSAYLETKTIPVLNEAFLELLRLEKFLLRYCNLPFGASLIVLAEKQSGKYVDQ
jgi:2-polyprenyl-3-methyl-5-hydroxy-6-metoxy-1,4-benzoquinol methylase